MMKIIQYLSLSMVVFSFFCSFAKAQDSEQLIARKWKIAQIEVLNQEQLEALTPEQKEMIQKKLDDMATNSYLDFKSDFTCEIMMATGASGPEQDTTQANWEIGEEGKTLITIEENGKRTELSILELAQEKMVLTDGTNMKMHLAPYED